MEVFHHAEVKYYRHCIGSDRGHGLFGTELYSIVGKLWFFSAGVLVYQKSALVTSQMTNMNLIMKLWFVPMYPN